MGKKKNINIGKRNLTDDEIGVIKELYQNKNDYKDTHAYVTTSTEVILKKWNGIHPPENNTVDFKVPPGTTLKIVMVSRFGDCGLTDDLNAVIGYHLRVDFDDPSIKDIRKTPNPPPCKNLRTRFEILRREK